MILDIGDQSTNIIKETILKSNMILWNGPLGAFEYKPFHLSTMELVYVIKNFSKILNIVTFAGGGDTISAIILAPLF